MKKKAIVIHSGGMDSSICLALAIREFGHENVLSLTFCYNQRHSNEIQQAAKICQTWGVDHRIISLNCLSEITSNALTDASIEITHQTGHAPNTLVVGRNGLMARLGAIHAHHLGANQIFMGVIEVEGSHSGYRDCSRDYMDLLQQILRLDLDDPSFLIRTPLVFLSKQETLSLANDLGHLDFLWEETISCYNGLRREGCKTCPACILRNEGLRQFIYKKA